MLIPSQIKRPNALAYAFTALAIVLVGMASSAYVYVTIDRTSRAHIVDRAETVAEAVSGDTLERLQAQDADLASPEYQAVKSLLMRMRAANHDVRFMYLVGSHADGALYFYADSEDPASPDYSPPGQEYPEATPLMHAILEGRSSATEGPDKDRWGVWISGYAPIHNSRGEVVALLGLDLPAAEFIFNASAYALLPLLIALLLLVLVTAAERLHAREFRAIGQKAEFLSIASHEIRTPLTGIRWAIESILKDRHAPADPVLKNMLEQVHGNCIALIARVNNLLDVTAFETKGGSVLHRTTFAIRPFVEEIADSLVLSARERMVRIEIDPSIPTDVMLTADAQTMHHVFFNLIANGVKYTRPETEVRISYSETPSAHLFIFTDHGDGMDPLDQEHIFEGYHRTEEAVRSGQYGSGLGLYLVRKAAELHGGSVRVESSKGAGASFTLELPKRSLKT